MLFRIQAFFSGLIVSGQFWYNNVFFFLFQNIFLKKYLNDDEDFIFDPDIMINFDELPM